METGNINKLSVRNLTYCALLGSLFYVIFHLFSNILYVEGITLTLFVCAQVFNKKEVISATILFGILQILFHGFMPWNLMYLILFPFYGLWFASLKKIVKKHEAVAWFCGALASFLLGQLVDLPFLLFDRKITMLYILLGFKTSLIQGAIVFIEFVLLYGPFVKILRTIRK
ncbi:hypothetical protein C815_01049 [Firmicutes bacterium M10-2]|nr:hypothetical protein C815_01049 [Firmicutes bacterium M10-2]